MRLYICRHGQTVMNLVGKRQGLCDSPLTEKGIEQAREISKNLKFAKPKAVYCSTSLRAVATAEIIAKAHNLKPVPLFELHEIYSGKFEGLTEDELNKLYPAEKAAREKDKFNVPFPGGESYKMVIERLKPFVEMVKKKHLNDEIIVSMHQASGKTLVWMLLGLPKEELLRMDLLHNMIFEIDFGKNGGKARFLLDGKWKDGVFYKE